MKKETGSTLRLGLFVTLSIVLFALAIFYIGQKQRLFSSTIKVKFVCDNVSGLRAGNNVRFSGINVGTVSSIRLTTDTTAEVNLILDKSVVKFIKKDAEASVGSDGLMGDKIVNIGPGSPDQPEIANNDIISYTGGNGMDEIMAEVKVVATNAAVITGDLAGIIDNIHQGRGAIGKLLMDTVFAGDLGKTLVNVKQAAGGFKQNMDAASHSFLLKGYFKKKAKADEKKAEEKKEQQEQKK